MVRFAITVYKEYIATDTKLPVLIQQPLVAIKMSQNEAHIAGHSTFQKILTKGQAEQNSSWEG